MRLSIVTASVNPEPTREFWESWSAQATGPFDAWMVTQGETRWEIPGFAVIHSSSILGPVPAFARGIRHADHLKPDIIACLHTDVRIDEKGWDARVIRFFQMHPKCGLLGFGGGVGLGSSTWDYSGPAPATREETIEALARRGFISNMAEAESHGARVTQATRVAALDGFSLIGRANLMLDAYNEMERWGMIHHAFDSSLGCFAAEAGYEVWMLPVRCHHAGGREAVGSQAYHSWAAELAALGDQQFWEDSHRIMYEKFKGILPLGVTK